MNIVLITQNDPFFLPQSIDYILKNLPAKFKVKACVLFEESPYGRKLSFLKKSLETIKIFGFGFFIFYGLRYAQKKLLLNSSVEVILKKWNIPIFRPEAGINRESSIEEIKKFEPELLVSIAGNQIFKKKLINLAPLGCINLHSALLPKYRGLMPSFWVLKNNEIETGVSVFYVDDGIDSGPIIIQKTIKIENKTHRDLLKESKLVGMQAVLEAIELIDSGNFKIIPNDSSHMTYYSFPTKEDVRHFRSIGKKFF